MFWYNNLPSQSLGVTSSYKQLQAVTWRAEVGPNCPAFLITRLPSQAHWVKMKGKNISIQKSHTGAVVRCNTGVIL